MNEMTKASFSCLLLLPSSTESSPSSVLHVTTKKRKKKTLQSQFPISIPSTDHPKFHLEPSRVCVILDATRRAASQHHLLLRLHRPISLHLVGHVPPSVRLTLHYKSSSSAASAAAVRPFSIQSFRLSSLPFRCCFFFFFFFFFFFLYSTELS